VSIIEVKDLSKHFKVLNRREGLAGAVRDLFSGDYRIVKAVDGVSFDIEAGEIVGYLGPNGAGKSTTIKMMTGILKPTDGHMLVDGNVPFKNRQKNAQNIGVIFGQRTQLWWDIPVVESFKLLREIYRVDRKDYERQMGMFTDLVGLDKLYSTPVRNLSLGQRMLCDIAASFLHNPKIVFLDEPTIGLDVAVKAKIRDVITTLNRTYNTTIILTTHDIGDVEALCRRIIIIDQGRVIYDGGIKTVTQLFGAYRTLKAQMESIDEETIPQFAAAFHDRFGNGTGVVVEHKEAGWLDVTINQDQLPMLEVLNFAMTSYPVKDIQIVEITMENVIKKIYDGALAS
jgi:ABC-2 type transport system ATP-binding protein